MIGTVYAMNPQPPEPDNTTYVEAGVVRIGVEYRNVNPDNLYETYKDDPAQLAELERTMPAGGFVDEGVSLHVEAGDDHHEYVRFDDDDPHYHYVHAGPEIINNWIQYDVVANGDMLTWALTCIGERLGEMLTEAGGGHLVDALDPAAIGRAIAEVRPMAEQARRAVRDDVARRQAAKAAKGKADGAANAAEADG
jgi:hypothetical protein